MCPETVDCTGRRKGVDKNNLYVTLQVVLILTSCRSSSDPPSSVEARGPWQPPQLSTPRQNTKSPNHSTAPSKRTGPTSSSIHPNPLPPSPREYPPPSIARCSSKPQSGGALSTLLGSSTGTLSGRTTPTVIVTTAGSPRQRSRRSAGGWRFRSSAWRIWMRWRGG